MIEHKVIVSQERGNIVVLVIDGVIQNEELEESEILVEMGHFNDFLKPYWNGIEWVEGLSEQELQAIEDEKLLETLIPTQEEIKKAELEISIITLLIELEVI